MWFSRSRGKVPRWSGRSVVCATVALVIAATTSCSSDSAPETSALGPEVDRIPGRAYAAVMIAPPAFEFAHDTVQDNSWVVFVDQDMVPLGYMHQKGMFRSQIARYRDGIVFADRESYFVTSREGTRIEPHDAGGISLQASTPYSLESSDSLLWLDDGMVNGKYRSTVIGVSPTGSPSIRKIDGRVVSSGRCQDTPYAVVSREFGKIGSEETYELAEIDMARRQPDRKRAEWRFDTASSGGRIPYSCDKNGQVSTYMSNGNPVSEGESVRSGFWTVNVHKGDAEWVPIPLDLASSSAEHGGVDTQYTAPFGSNTSWQNREGVEYVDSRGQVSMIKNGQTVASYLFTIAPDIRDRDLDAVAVGEGLEGVSYLTRTDSSGSPVSGTGDFVFTNFASGKEIRRIPTPEWLSDLVASDPFVITDIALVGDVE